MANDDNLDAGTGSYVAAGSDWTADENFWRTHYVDRPYVSSDRGFEYYRSAYRYGHDAAAKHRGHKWSDVEADLRAGWAKFEGGGETAWEHVKGAVRDAWERVAGR